MGWHRFDTSPPVEDDRQILVRGGLWCGELTRPEPYKGAALVRAKLSGADWSQIGYCECGGEGYASWVIGPTHWCEVPPLSEHES